MANGMNWRPPTAEEEALQAPAWYADPINWIQPASGVARKAALGLGRQAEGLVRNLAVPVEGGVAAAPAATAPFIEKAGQFVPSEIRDISKVAGWIGEKLGLGAGGVMRRGAETVARQPITTMVSSAYANPSGWGMGGGANRQAAVPAAQAAEPTVAAKPAVDVQAIRQQFNDDPYAYLSHLASTKPDEFMALVDKHRENPLFAGIGYRHGGTRDDGTREIVPVFESRDRGAGGGRGLGGGVPEGMDFGRDLSLAEMKALAPFFTASVSAREANDLRRQHLDQMYLANQLGLQEKRESKREALTQREEENFDKNIINVYGRTTEGTVNPAKGLIMAAVLGEKIPPARQAAAQRLASPVLSHIAELEKKKGGKVSETDKLTILKNYMDKHFKE